MSAVMTEAETKFFDSKGETVDPALKPAEPAKAPESGATVVPAIPPAAAPAEPTTPQVPLTALHEERKARQQAEADRKTLQAQITQFQQQLEQLQKAQQPPPPDPNQDPIGAVLHQQKQNQATLEQIQQWRNEQDQYTHQLLARQKFQQDVMTSEQAFRTKQPDYDAAANYALQQYDKLLTALIPDPAARNQRVMQEAMGSLWAVMQEGRDPAQFIYDLAKHMGYAGPQAPAAPNAAPAIAAPSIPALTQQTVPAAVAAIERGLKQQGNPGGGGSPNGEITAEMALKLPNDEFNKWWGKSFRR